MANGTSAEMASRAATNAPTPAMASWARLIWLAKPMSTINDKAKRAIVPEPISVSTRDSSESCTIATATTVLATIQGHRSREGAIANAWSDPSRLSPSWRRARSTIDAEHERRCTAPTGRVDAQAGLHLGDPERRTPGQRRSVALEATYERSRQRRARRQR